MTAGCRHRWPPVVLRRPLGWWTGGPECRVCTHSLENGLTPTGRAVDVFKVMEKQVSLSLALRAPAEPGRRLQTWKTAEQASAGQVMGRLLCLSLDVSRQPGPGVQNEKQHWEAWGPAPQGPWSEQLRMDVLLDGMRRGTLCQDGLGTEHVAGILCPRGREATPTHMTYVLVHLAGVALPGHLQCGLLVGTQDSALAWAR